MSSTKYTDLLPSLPKATVIKEEQIETAFLNKLSGLKYTLRSDITNRATLERNFREKFEALNRVHLTDAEFARLLDEIITPDVFTASKTLRSINSFTCDDGTPLNYTLVNIKDWCKNHFEVVHQLRINTDYSHHRFDVLLLINGVPVTQIELKTLGVNPRRAMEQIVEYKNDPGNGYIWHTTGSGKTLTSFKASTLLKENDYIHKCVFVVDRKDLDRQTREEFNRFQKGCVEENTNTAALVRRLLSEDYADKVIVTTIQKLGLALDETSKRLKTQLDQYTDLTEENKGSIQHVLPEETHRGFRGAYLETAQRLKEQRGKPGNAEPQLGSSPIDQIDFEFVIFASAVIDYDYIMGLIAKFSAKGPGKSKMTREELIGLISSDAKFMNERDDIAEYIGTLKAGEGLSEAAIRDGYSRFKAEKNSKEVADIAARHHLATAALQTFVDGILDRMIFDGEQLSDLMAPLDLGWKARTKAELALMEELHPLLTKRAGGRDISGLSAYES